MQCNDKFREEIMKVYTMKDWERDGVLKMKTGQIVTDDVINELKNDVPPTTYKYGYFQTGEAVCHDSQFVPFYYTFKRTDEGWKYEGKFRALNI